MRYLQYPGRGTVLFESGLGFVAEELLKMFTLKQQKAQKNGRQK